MKILKKLPANVFLNQLKDNNKVIVSNNNIFLYSWSFDQEKTIPLVIKDFAESNIENFNIYILAAEEFEVGNNFEKIINISLAEKFLSKNLNVNFIFGSQDLKFYQQDNFLYHSPNHNMHVHLWPTFWFNCTLKSSDYFYLKEKLNQEKNNIIYPYISLNNVGKYHRCLLIDLLAKNNMLEIGAVTWHNFCVDTNYSWNWIESNKVERKLSDSSKYLKDNYVQQFTPPEEFFQSFMSVISETTDKTVFITEKTSIALLLKQPFLVQGAVGFHSYLQSIGFELYTELFDYSFDKEIDIHKRTEMIIGNIKSILNSDLNKLYNLIKPKLKYNQKKFFEIVYDESIYPKIVNNSKILKDHYTFGSSRYDL